jgi:hypothetical protein
LGTKQSLLITTRNRHLGEELSNGGECIEIPQFTPEEAILLLRIKPGNIANSWNDLDLEVLVEMLSRVSLAISQVAAYMK